MESTIENQGDSSRKPSMKSAWHNVQGIWSASSMSEAWGAFKQTIEAMPMWGIVLMVIGGVALVANASHFLLPIAAAGLLAAVYFTVKLAVLSALRQHESQRQSSPSQDESLL